MIITSYPNNKQFGNKFLFHHIGKTGGTTFSAAIYGICQTTDLTEAFIAKGLNPLKAITGYPPGNKKRVTTIADLAQKRDFIYGHNSLCLWEQIKSSHKAITITRETASRVTSMYFWIKKASDLSNEISTEDFKQFIYNKNYQNQACWSLLKYFPNYISKKYDNYNQKKIGEDAIKILRENFYLICTTNNLNKLISHIASYSGSQSLSIEKLKEVVDERKIEYIDKMKDIILEFNYADVMLHEYALSRKKDIETKLPLNNTLKANRTYAVKDLGNKLFQGRFLKDLV